MQFVSNTEKQKKELFSSIGAQKFEELISNIPKQALFAPVQNGLLKNGVSEMEALAHLQSLASKNKTVEQFASFLGAGSYHHFIPSVVNALISRGEFLTAYTPYQPEASQGTLQATFEFQSMIADLYGMDAANASLYDGASALTEAAFLAMRETGRKKILVSRSVHPEYRQTLKTYCVNYEVVELPALDGTTSLEQLEKTLDETAACVLVQNPNFFGCVEPLKEMAEMAHSNGSLLAVSADPISLGILLPPGESGADIATGEGQPLGISMNYGGPYLGLFSCKEKLIRKMPGRVVGLTKDLSGQRGYVLTLQTREQHIRREKATSNICTNEALMALASAVYLSVLGPQGLKEVSELNLQKAHYAASRISQIPGFSLFFKGPFFNEFVVRSKTAPEKIEEILLKNKIVGGLSLGRHYPELSDCALYCVTEMNTKEEIDSLVQVLKSV